MQVSEKLIGRIRSELPRLTLLENEPMSAHCSFRIGGPARLMACPASASEAAALLHILHEEQAPTELMGKGTNLLVPDTGLDAVVVLVGEAMSDAELLPDSRIRAGAGISLAKLAVYAAGCGLSGLEFAHGIPGSLGGAVFMNAGAYGGEMKDVVEEVECADAEGKLEVLSVSELQLSYRHSALEGTGNLRDAQTESGRAGGDTRANARTYGKAPCLAAAGPALRGQHVQKAAGRFRGGANGPGRAQGLCHRRGAGLRKARRLRREPRRSDVRGRHAAHATYTENRF